MSIVLKSKESNAVVYLISNRVPVDKVFDEFIGKGNEYIGTLKHKPSVYATMFKKENTTPLVLELSEVKQILEEESKKEKKEINYLKAQISIHEAKLKKFSDFLKKL